MYVNNVFIFDNCQDHKTRIEEGTLWKGYCQGDNYIMTFCFSNMTFENQNNSNSLEKRIEFSLHLQYLPK